MVSTDTARMGIIRRAREPQPHTITRYGDVRNIICAYLADPSRKLDHLVRGEQMFSHRMSDSAEGVMRKEDARLSMEVLHAIQGMANQIAQYEFVLPPRKQPKLTISGVTVSVRADLYVHGRSRNQDQIGTAILRMTKSDGQEKRRQMGLYVATLAKLHMDNIPTNRIAARRLCMSIDVQQGEVFLAPTAYARRVRDLENACLAISALWNRV